jgi:hypothetical protein
LSWKWCCPFIVAEESIIEFERHNLEAAPDEMAF